MIKINSHINKTRLLLHLLLTQIFTVIKNKNRNIYNCAKHKRGFGSKLIEIYEIIVPSFGHLPDHPGQLNHFPGSQIRLG